MNNSATGSECSVQNEPEKRSRSHETIVLLVLLATLLLLLLLWPRGIGDNYDQTSIEHSSKSFVVTHSQCLEQTEVVGESLAHLWSEYRGLMLAAIVIALIKIMLVGETASEVIACGLEVVAFLLTHTIEFIRFTSIGLRRLAKDLREK